MSLIKKLAGDTIIYGMSTILPRILHFVVFTVYLTHRFDDQLDFGIYTDMYAYATIILVILTFRMETAYFRFASREPDQSIVFGTAMTALFWVTIALVGLLFLFTPQIAEVLHYSDRPYYIRWFAMILGFDALIAVPFAKLRLDNRPKRFLYYKLLNIFVTVVLVVFFLEFLPLMSDSGFKQFLERPHKVDYVFIANLIASGSVFLLMIPEFFKTRVVFDGALFAKMLLYSLPLVVVGIAGNFNQSFAVPLQKELLGNSLTENLTDGGIYAACAKLALLLNLFIVAFNYAAEPFFFNQFKEKDSREVFGKVAHIFTIISGFALLFIYLNLPFIKHILPEDYQSAIHVVPYLLFAYFFLGLYYNFSIWYKLVDKTHIGALIAICGAVITFGVSLYFLPRIGVTGSAYAALACYSFMALAGYITGKIYYPIDYPMIKILFYTALCAIIVLVSYSFQLSGWMNIGLLVLYVGVAYVLDRKEIMTLFQSNPD